MRGLQSNDWCPYEVRETWTQSCWSGWVKTVSNEAMLLQAKVHQGLPDNTEAGKSHRDRPHLEHPLHEPSARAHPL